MHPPHARENIPTPAERTPLRWYDTHTARENMPTRKIYVTRQKEMVPGHTERDTRDAESDTG
ncbi:MAG: hypothetical protein NTW29_12595 [Bacteroidetes bacterium]|nr:hypothetical protein [Bacteroidota bacterium]